MKVWTKEDIIAKIREDPNWVERAILAIHGRQTPAEQSAHTTMIHNSVGFNAFDAKTGSYYADWISKGKHLSGRHLEKGRKIALRYVGQLEKIANGG